jgi:hypothetical protein
MIPSPVHVKGVSPPHGGDQSPQIEYEKRFSEAVVSGETIHFFLVTSIT